MRITVAASSFLLVATAAHAGLPQTWTFDESTTGGDVLWTSPTAVDPSAEVFAGVYEITLVEVTAIVFGFPLDLDVTDQVPPELLIGTGDAVGPAPVTLADLPVVFPDPPAAPAIAADISVSLNADGFGTLSATNIILGDYDSPFGVVPITGMRIAGTVEVLPTVLADVNRDNRVNVDDLVQVVTAWGLCPDLPEECPADVTLDGEVDVDDLVEVIVKWDG
jgi:hypothetical protein